LANTTFVAAALDVLREFVTEWRQIDAANN
jgi:hypothetical protein